MKIAVLLTVFNRKEKTLTCLQSLYNQKLGEDVTFEVFLTDDNSTDGSTTAVNKKFPDVKVFNGSGSLFWAGGMRNSWSKAVKTNPDFYLLLNDDTLLLDTAIAQLLNYNNLKTDNIPAICIGSTYDELSGNISYGGQKLLKKNKVQYSSIQSENKYIECDMANANIMLVPKEIVNEIGILSEEYTHSIADFDYTLKAKKAGFKNIVAPGYLGTCTDDHGKNWKSADVPLSERIRYLKSPKGLGYAEYLHFIKTHFPLHLPAAFTKLWLKTLFPVMWEKFKKTN
jgi:GT2 family glycosyltransferase